MIEYWDVYDEDKNYIGKYDRGYVHENAIPVNIYIFKMDKVKAGGSVYHNCIGNLFY